MKDKIREKVGKNATFYYVWKIVGRESDGRDSYSREKGVAPYLVIVFQTEDLLFLKYGLPPTCPSDLRQ